MIRKGQVLHGEGVTGRWQVRHCQKNETKKHQEGPKPNHHVLLMEPSEAAIHNSLLMRNVGSNDAVLLLKIYPSMSKEDPSCGFWWLVVVVSRLGSITGTIQVWDCPNAFARLEWIESLAPAYVNLLVNNCLLSAYMCLQPQWNRAIDCRWKCPPMWCNHLMCW